jgi:hypothetical protein
MINIAVIINVAIIVHNIITIITIVISYIYTVTFDIKGRLRNQCSSATGGEIFSISTAPMDHYFAVI